MATMQFGRQEVVGMLRRAGLRKEADEAMRVLPHPVDLDRLGQWGAQHGITREKVSSAGWVAAHDTVRRQLIRPLTSVRRQAAAVFRHVSTAVYRAPRHEEGHEQMMAAQVEKDLVFATHDGTELALDIYRAPHDDAPVTVYIHGGGWPCGG